MGVRPFLRYTYTMTWIASLNVAWLACLVIHTNL